MTKKEFLELIKDVEDDACMFVSGQMCPEVCRVVAAGIEINNKSFTIVYNPENEANNDTRRNSKD